MQTSQRQTAATWRKSSYSSSSSGGDCVECAPLGTAEWRKSTYSSTSGGECVECAPIGTAGWRKSTYSGSSGGDCVEVAPLTPHIAVCDSKNPGAGAYTVTPGAFSSFVAYARSTS